MLGQLIFIISDEPLIWKQLLALWRGGITANIGYVEVLISELSTISNQLKAFGRDYFGRSMQVRSAGHIFLYKVIFCLHKHYYANLI
jgi:hypothetical protein